MGCGKVELLGQPNAVGSVRGEIAREIIVRSAPWSIPPGVTLAVGCGWGSRAETLEQLKLWLSQDNPLVLDADALTLLARLAEEKFTWKRSAPIVLTPHPKEACRLMWHDDSVERVRELEQNRTEVTSALARRYQATVLLKGAGSVVSDGREIFVVLGASAGLARAGSGDVLTGMVAALLSQGVAPVKALANAASVHLETALRLEQKYGTSRAASIDVFLETLRLTIGTFEKAHAEKE